MLDSGALAQLVFVNTLGLSVLMQTIRTAAYMFITSNARGVHISESGRTKKAAKECLAFIQGTGLELLLVRHCIDYDADMIRDVFFNHVKCREYFE